MKGLDIARDFFFERGLPMLKGKFPSETERLAAGLAGEGSECFGFDDEFSRDHDWGPGFCLWLNDEDFANVGAEMTAAYRELGNEYKGFRRNQLAEAQGRVGPQAIGDFYSRFIGQRGIPETLRQWRIIPESNLASVTNGEVFYDNSGEFTAVRRGLTEYYPEDVRIKKIVTRAAFMAQSGQYNYRRCEKRGEKVAAMMAVAAFVENATSMAFLLNRKYKPFYKWMHRAMKDLPLLNNCYSMIERLCEKDRSPEENEEVIEAVCADVLRELKRQGLTDGTDPFLLEHCQKMMRHIKDDEIKALHIMQD